MHSAIARQIAWTPPPELASLAPAQKADKEAADIAAEPPEDEALDWALAEMLMAAECDRGCDYSDGPLASTGCHW